ncbi:hypothetical protein PC116_g24597 [Phytophthora cactorum]|uniref:Uncharacterized protein n=1 Tax=Phytophthora cactorum TaxID=29920 RepID=A0A8T1JYY1_9STRA|nr:hypothetical protein Pcac1_g3136 [Phytophthora cactorum]KAG2879915.1 hypothetical protein PC114_g22329 [Phytophthora cactorum]KAG2899658.1 hypothetical protein PC117_g22179 [Phytophthora cactorum]KAG2978019.1 hypothetical protein PC119_g21865 [Phytophthora cactorum]KAG3004886.1 hypothetical protein PC120_g18296 [Phytophthora cactorum]
MFWTANGLTEKRRRRPETPADRQHLGVMSAHEEEVRAIVLR